ncbi:MAG: pitrilysin family protein [Vicinamibacterales bacterium]|jgi:predicted Zn-dependent peptidase|nr:hypothetical protein [Acidobacteriota bacterium]MDP7293886.1 pitrilysin family protein [Vicinamibacterales bacterium]MDP7471869.1 pitrilysin family protein [Vicinamibacterales bacterium]MDP7671537.1 pitrilysin family protein [Vicinamibacterales bacterium]HJO39468.1 pitrilysin family protein [Vicinamibacterales bacterium]
MALDRSRLPVVDSDPPFAFPTVHHLTLLNGLDVRIVEHRKMPVVSAVLLLPGGSATDPAGHPGLMSLTAALLDEGCGERSSLALYQELGRLGAQLDVEVGMDASTVRMTTLGRRAEAGLALLAQLASEPRFEADAVDRVRALRLDRLAQLRDVPAAVADRAFARLLYGDGPYGHVPSGTRPGIRDLARDDIVAAHAGAYRPAGATLVVVGDGTDAALERMVTAAFGGWTGGASTGKEGPAAAARGSAEANGSEAARLVVVDRPGAAQSELRLGHVGVARSTPDYFPLLVMNMALGGQFTSRINLNLRETHGYTYGARSSFEFRRQPGPFSVATSVHTRVTCDAIREVLGELHGVRDGRPLAVEEIARAKAALTRGYPRGFETAEQIGRGLAQLALHGLPDDHFSRFGPRVAAVEAADVARVAEAYLDPARLAAVIVGDLTAMADGLPALGLGALAPMTLP